MLKLLIALDDGPPASSDALVRDALAYEEVIAAQPPMERITRREDDIYILYTGGTTGMPKGVMYAMGGLTAAFVQSGFPLLGLPMPADPSQIAGVVGEAAAAGGSLHLDPGLPAHARHRGVVGHLHPAPRRRHGGHTREQISRPA